MSIPKGFFYFFYFRGIIIGISEPKIDVELCGTDFFDVDETFENYTDTSSDNSIQSETIETSSV